MGNEHFVFTRFSNTRVPHMIVGYLSTSFQYYYLTGIDLHASNAVSITVMHKNL